MNSQLITVQNHQTVLPRTSVLVLVDALSYWLHNDYGSSPWVTEGYSPPAHVSLLAPGKRPPRGAWNLVLLDNSSQAGTLGFHDDEGRNQIPYSDVFVATALADGADPSAVACHEAIEMLVDPYVQHPRLALNPADDRRYIVEPGDPVEGNDYALPVGGRGCDFVLPAWFGFPESEAMPGFSFRGSVTKPFELAPQGYISWQENGQWHQTFGTQAYRLPKWASRLPRIHG